MKILIIAYYFPPSTGAAPLRPYYWAKYWSEAGHDVTILTKNNAGTLSLPELPGVEIISLTHFDIYTFFRKKNRTRNDNQTSEITQKNPSLLKRILYFLQKHTGILSSVRMPEPADFWYFPARRWLNKTPKQWDLIVSTCGPYVTHLIAHYAIAHKKASLWNADYRDMWTQHSFFRGLFPFTLLEKVLEKYILKKCTSLSTVDPYLVQILENKYTIKTFLAYNGYDPLPLTCTKRRNSITIAYIGTFYRKIQNIELLCAALQLLKRDNSQLFHNLSIVFAGTNDIHHITTLFTVYEIASCLTVTRPVPHDEAIALQHTSDALLFVDYWDVRKNRPVPLISQKLIEYCFSNTEILIIGSPIKTYRADIIIESGCGAFFQTADELFLHIKNICLHGKNNISPRFDYLNKFTRKQSSTQLLSDILAHSHQTL